MEGILFAPRNCPRRHPEQSCAECGRSFRPRVLVEGSEELCDECYLAQFQSRRLRHWQKPQRSHLSRQS